MPDTVTLVLVPESNITYSILPVTNELAIPTETTTTFPIINSETVTLVLLTELNKTSTVIPRSGVVEALTGHFPKLVTLGCGEYQCLITRRGGGSVQFEVAFSQINIQKVIDNAGTCTINLPEVATSSGLACCEVVAETEPWRDELIVYRGNDIAFVGPVVRVDGDAQQLIARDLFFWTEKRFIEEDLHFWDDVAYTFRAVFLKAMEQDTSPNVDIIVHPTGVSSIRDYEGKEVHRSADLLRELARTAIDFTVIERTVYAGGKEVFAPESVPGTPLLLHDQGVLRAAVVKDGEAFATDVAVFAGSPQGKGKGGQARGVPLVGRATRQTETYGLVQSVFTELLITDLESVNQNALSRLEAMQPAPLSVHVVFSPDAAFEFTDIIPGRRVDSRLSETSCIDVVDMIRLANVNISATGKGEAIEGDLVPLGEFDNVA